MAEVSRSIIEILKLNHNIPSDWEILSREYIAQDIDKLTIDGYTVKDYSAYQFIWEKTYAKEPERNPSGKIGNLNSYATFVTAHILINFALMPIDDYRHITRKDLEKNEFLVSAYDPIYNQKTVQKMYFATPEIAKLFTLSQKRFNADKNEWESYIRLVGVQNYTLDMVGTNNDLDTYNIVYHLNPPPNKGNDETIGSKDYYIGEEIIIGQDAKRIVEETFGGEYSFVGWTTQPNATEIEYIDNTAYTINAQGLTLYALWKATSTRVLTYNYGLSTPMLDTSTGQYIVSKNVEYNKSIGMLPKFDLTPSVKYNNKIYYPYINGAWYKTATKGINSVPIKDNELYWTNSNTQIHLLYDTIEYTLKYNTNYQGYIIADQQVKYGSTIALPKLIRTDAIFEGWYDDTGALFSGTMPPYNLTLTAKWSKK